MKIPDPQIGPPPFFIHSTDSSSEPGDGKRSRVEWPKTYVSGSTRKSLLLVLGVQSLECR